MGPGNTLLLPCCRQTGSRTVLGGRGKRIMFPFALLALGERCGKRRSDRLYPVLSAVLPERGTRERIGGLQAEMKSSMKTRNLIP